MLCNDTRRDNKTSQNDLWHLRLFAKVESGGGLCSDSNESQLVGAVHLVCRYAVNTMAHVVCVRVRTGLADLLTGRLQRPRNFRAPAHPEIPALL